jgi:hypothetical protein
MCLESCIVVDLNLDPADIESAADLTCWSVVASAIFLCTLGDYGDAANNASRSVNLAGSDLRSFSLLALRIS